MPWDKLVPPLAKCITCWVTGLAKKKKAGAWSLLAILASLCLASYLVANWLQKLETKHCLLRRSYFCSYVCVVSQFDLSITKWNYLFVRCQSLSHIPNTSLRCSNQPLWKLNLMMGVNTTKQQNGKIKNRIKRVIWANWVSWCPGKKNVLINNCFESCQGEFSVKILGK